MSLLRRRFRLLLLLHEQAIGDRVRLVQIYGYAWDDAAYILNKASTSTETPIKIDPSGNILTIVVDRG